VERYSKPFQPNLKTMPNHYPTPIPKHNRISNLNPYPEPKANPMPNLKPRSLFQTFW